MSSAAPVWAVPRIPAWPNTGLRVVANSRRSFGSAERSARGVMTRRNLLQGGATLAFGGLGFVGYSAVQDWRLAITRYRIRPAGWPEGLRLRLALIADVHVCEPWMGLAHLEQIVARTDALAPDAVLMLGDFQPGRHISRYSRSVVDRDWTRILSQFKAPLGVHAVLGNHDWWDEPELQRLRRGPTRTRIALEAAGVPVYENEVVRCKKDGRAFWIAGLGDQWAFHQPRSLITTTRRSRRDGFDDLPGTMAKITDDAPIILMAHEPDIFPHVPNRVALTVSGHTHGGQVNVLGLSPTVPSAFGARYRYGHIIEQGRHLVVSAGLGYSGAPIRLGVPAEIVIVDLGADHYDTA